MSLLGRKWSQFAAKIYYLKLSLYVIFLLSLTGYILTSAPLRSPYREKDCSINIDLSKWDMFLFIYIGKYVVIILALAHMVFEVIFICCGCCCCFCCCCFVAAVVVIVVAVVIVVVINVLLLMLFLLLLLLFIVVDVVVGWFCYFL